MKTLACVALLLGFAYGGHEEHPEVIPFYLYLGPEDLDALYNDPQVGDVPGRFGLSPAGPLEEGLRVGFWGDVSPFLPKRSFVALFDEGQDFLFGDARMNSSAMYADPSMMRERLAFEMFHLLGRPAPRTRYVDLYLNDVYEGLYLHVEPVDEGLLEHTGLNSDAYTLVRDSFRDEEGRPLSVFGFDLDRVDDVEGFLRETFEHRGDPDWFSLADILRWVHDTPAGPEYAAGFRAFIDLESFVDWLAIHYLVGDTGSFAGDYWLYLDDTTPGARWMFIPERMARSFGSRVGEGFELGPFFAYESPLIPDPSFAGRAQVSDPSFAGRAQASYGENLLISKFLETEALKSRLEERLAYLMGRVFTESYFLGLTDATAAAIEESVNRRPGTGAFSLHPKNHYGSLGRFRAHLESLRDYVGLRYRYLDRQINPVEGRPYRATVDLRAYAPGDTVYFTDARGWTIAKFYLIGLTGPAEMTVAVGRRAGLDGVDRVWTVELMGIESDDENDDNENEADEGEVENGDELVSVVGIPFFYYRNDPARGGNWYPQELPVGGQWGLRAAVVREGEINELPSRANPYSNKVIATALHFQEARQFAVVHEAGAHRGDLLRTLELGADFDEAGWLRLSGRWAFAYDALLQLEEDPDQILSHWRSFSPRYTLRAEVRHLIGSGGGVLFNMLRQDSTAGAHLVRFSEDGRTLFWGYFDEENRFIHQGDAPVASPGGGAKRLEVVVGSEAYGVSLDGETLASGVPLLSREGRLGLISSASVVAFEWLEVEP